MTNLDRLIEVLTKAKALQTEVQELCDIIRIPTRFRNIGGVSKFPIPLSDLLNQLEHLHHQYKILISEITQS